MRRIITSLCLTVAMTATTASAQVMFAGNGGSGGSVVNAGALLSIDMTSWAVTVVGVPTDPADPDGITGLDFNSQGRLFVTTGEGGATGAPRLLEIDPLTGAMVNEVGYLTDGVEEIYVADISFQPGTDVLYGIIAFPGGGFAEGELVTIDITDATVTSVGVALGNDTTGSTKALAFAPDGTLYYLHTNVAETGPALHTLNPATGAIISSVDLPGAANYMGAAVAPDGTLYTSQGAGGTFGVITTIDPATGALTFVTSTGNVIHDLAFQPAVSPQGSAVPTLGAGVLLLLALTLAGVGFLLLRR